MLMDIANLKFSYLEIVGSTIQMLLTDIDSVFQKASEIDEIIHF